MYRAMTGCIVGYSSIKNNPLPREMVSFVRPHLHYTYTPSVYPVCRSLKNRMHTNVKDRLGLMEWLPAGISTLALASHLKTLSIPAKAFLTHVADSACPDRIRILTRTGERAYHRHLAGPLEGVQTVPQTHVLSPGRGRSCEKHSSNSSMR